MYKLHGYTVHIFSTLVSNWCTQR